MSLRPSFAGFDLDKLKSIFGSNDVSVIEHLFKQYAEFVYNSRELDQADQIINGIIVGNFLQAPPSIENEVFQNVMACLVEHSQKLISSDSLFWEAFIVDVAANNANYDEGPNNLLRYLLEGRPLLGKSIESSWSYYAYFTNIEARTLFAFIRDHERFQQEYDYESASIWMEQIEQTGADVWFYAS